MTKKFAQVTILFRLSMYRDGADVQYMQCLSKSCIPSLLCVLCYTALDVFQRTVWAEDGRKGVWMDWKKPQAVIC